MSTQILIKKENKALKPVLKELKKINAYLRKLLLIIPEESLKDYKNSSKIKNSYLKAIKKFPPIK